MKSFHNTIEVTGEELARYEMRAGAQEEHVYRAYKNHKKLTPSEAWDWLYPNIKLTPLTSIRRAISNLTAKGALEKTKEQKTGIYGKPEYYWKIAEQ